MRGLLDLTDNIVGGAIVPPREVVRHDGDDPYLVVAADKGTATFSDIANGVSAEYGFWLGDAFASGGSEGYDHKAMGITARGAWEAVKRHFRELGTDIQDDRLHRGRRRRHVGRRLRQRHAAARSTSSWSRAFDHRHIFLDPDPDPGKSFAERRRLFELPRSSWADYDRALISRGGGVFERGVKSIALSPEMRARCSASRRQALTPGRADPARCSRRRSTCCGSAASAPTSRRSEREPRRCRRQAPTTRCASTPRSSRCKVVGEGANLGRDPARAHRVTP